MEQARFWSGISTLDYIHTVSQFTKKTNEYRTTLCLAFVDYEKAFNSVEIVAVLNAIRQQDVGDTYCRSLEDIYAEFTVVIKVHKYQEKFQYDKKSEKVMRCHLVN